MPRHPFARPVLLAIPTVALVVAAGTLVPTAPAAATIAPVATWGTAARIDSLVVAFQRRTGTPGITVAVVHRDGTTQVVPVGLADLDHDVPVRAATVFRTGSVTKSVTAALVMQLVDSGRVALDDAIGAHVEGLPVAWRGVTVRQLLAHTGGVPSHTDAGARWRRRWGEALPAESLLAIAAADPVRFAPGSRWQYSNTGYVVLGRLLERMHRQALDAVVEQRVTRALDLPSLRRCDDRAVVAHRARGYVAAPDSLAPGARDGVVPAEHLELSHGFGAGDLCANAIDLVRWSQALATGRLVTEASFRTMARPTGAAAAWRYGLGTMIDTIGRFGVVGHDGDIPGFAAAMLAVPEAGVHVAVLANRGGVAARRLAHDVARLALGLPLEAPPVVQPFPLAERPVVLGRYVLEMPGVPTAFALVEAGEGVALAPDGTTRLPLRYFGRDTLHRAGHRPGDVTHVFGAAFDPQFRLRLIVRAGHVLGGEVRQGGGVFPVVRSGR